MRPERCVRRRAGIHATSKSYRKVAISIDPSLPVQGASMAITALLALAAAQAPIEGLWKNPSGSVIMAIAPCGDLLCGTVKWASEKAKKDAAKGTKQLIGADLLTALKAVAEGQWKGRLFVPDQKMRVHAQINLLSQDQLKVSGCALGKSLCKS